MNTEPVGLARVAVATNCAVTFTDIPHRLEPPGEKVHTDGHLVYAVGDIHGQLDLLEALLAAILEDARHGPAGKICLFFLGDYIDRGPESKQVVERLIGLKAPGVRVACLCGNHEDLLLTFLKDGSKGPAWWAAGAPETLASYGLPVSRRPTDAQGWEDLRAALAQALPEPHLRFYEKLFMMAEVGSYVFVHAGVRPGVPLGIQDPQDLMWIRHPFLEAPHPADKIVVHGHTPEPEPFIGRHRLGIDTGAYATGTLTATRLYHNEMTIIQSIRQ